MGNEQPAETPVNTPANTSGEGGSSMKHRIHTTRQLVPGVALAAAVMAGGYGVSAIIGRIIPFEHNPVSPLLLTIIIGLIIRNVLVLPTAIKPGIAFGIKRLLRFGIILMGIRVSLMSVARIGAAALGLVAVCIAGALIIVSMLTRLMKVNPRLGSLIAAGTSICGVSAIVAASPIIGATEDETAYAVGTITLFGLIATALYPYLTELVLHLDISQAGFFLGTSVHDTSQVTAASLIYHELWNRVSESGLTGPDIAVTTKLVRNTLMIAVLPLLGFAHNRRHNPDKKHMKLSSVLPLFVIGYIAMGGVRSAGDALFHDAGIWTAFYKGTAAVSTYVVAAAIACIGLNTNIKSLRQLGYKPFLIGLSAAVALGIISYVLVNVFHAQLVF